MLILCHSIQHTHWLFIKCLGSMPCCIMEPKRVHSIWRQLWWRCCVACGGQELTLSSLILHRKSWSGWRRRTENQDRKAVQGSHCIITKIIKHQNKHGDCEKPKAKQTVSIKTCFAFELGKNSQLLIYRKNSHTCYIKKINAKYEKITTHTWIIIFLVVNLISYTIAHLIWLSESFYYFFLGGGVGLGEGLLSLINTFLFMFLSNYTC